VINERNRLLEKARDAMLARGLLDEKYKARFRAEAKEIDAQGEWEYLCDLCDRKAKFPYNEHNLFFWYLLDLCDDFDIDKEYAWIQGELPDIDIDYIRDVRDHLNSEWAPNFFGREKVCAIGTYGSLGIKSAILDMTRVYGVPKDEIQSITVKMKDKYEDEGKTKNLDWDAALRLYSDFKEYCDKNPKVAEAAKLALDRNKTGGVHAGGLIIADRRIDNFVPLEVRKVNKDNPNGVICSAWGEGLKAQDLAPVGLVKFDLLVIRNLDQIAYACKLIKERYPEMGKKGICARPGDCDWSDISYLNDPKALAMADAGDLTCVFQFDSEGIQKLVKRGGVSCFDDLAAYSALYRPGPLNMGMDARYCKRKKGEEPYNLHPVLQKALGKTYGVMVYQEQVMEILRAVGKIPDMHTEKVRKAISKKKIEQFAKYKEQFIHTGQKVLGVNKQFVSDLWEQIESFAEYGFNKSILMDTKIPTPHGDKEAKDFVKGDKVYCVNEQGDTVETDVVAVHDHGVLPAFEVTFDDGYQTTCSIDHKFLTEIGQMSLREICQTRSSILCDQKDRRSDHGEAQEGWLEDQMWSNGQDEEVDVTAPQRVREVLENRLENKRGRDRSCSQISLWERILDLERAKEASQGMLRVRSNQAREHSRENGKIEQGQRASRQEEKIFRNSKEDICSTRDTGSTCKTASQVAERESREVCQMYRSGLEESEAISNGSVVARAIGLGDGEDSMWENSEAGRFCERQDLDRSGWILPFLRASQSWSQSIQVADRSTTRSDVEGGGVTPCECDVDPNGHDMFQEQFGGDERGLVQTLAGHAPISNTGRLVSRKIVRVRYVGKRRMCDLEVANPTHNFLLPNGIVTSNSHAYAYTYISSRLLWLKAHYPIEFYAAVLMCEKESEKLKDYKLDAAKHNVRVRPVNINKSKENFSIYGNEIFFGFENIKGIGHDSAARIVESQPYKSYLDFLDRFGTDAKELTRLTALGCFDELEPNYDHITLRKFHEFYKDIIKKRRDRNSRFEKRMVELDERLREEILSEVGENDADFESLCQFTDEAEKLWEERFSNVTREEQYKSKGEVKTRTVPFTKVLSKIRKDKEKSAKANAEKERVDEENRVSIDNFNPYNIELKPEEIEILSSKRQIDEEVSYPLAESEYYGFQWIHKLETSPDYSGMTIDKFLADAAEGNLNQDGAGTIEIVLNAIRKRQSKTIKKDGTRVEFWSLDVEDANARQMTINMWSDDHIRFKDKLLKGAMLRMEVRPPGGGFNTLTFKSYPRHKKREIPPKEKDFRCWTLKEPAIVKPKELDLSDFQFDASAIEGLENHD
jgi:hypothetical protein